MERHYSKEQILEAFLNPIAFGHGWYGIDAAARHYFGKPAAQLTLAEAASLASMPKSPVQYDPARFPARNRERRNTVLDLMAEQGYVTRAQADAAQREPVRTVPDGGMTVAAPWFVDVVRVQAERAGVSVRDGGYRIYTTLDPRCSRPRSTPLARAARRAREAAGLAASDLRDSIDAAADAVARKAADLSAGRGRRHRAGHGRGARARRRPRLRRLAVQPRGRRPAAARLVVQAVRLRGGARGRPRAQRTGRRHRARDRSCPKGASTRPDNSDNQFLGLAHHARGARALAQPGRRAARAAGRDGLGHRAGAPLRHPLAHRAATRPARSARRRVQPLDFVTSYATFANLGVRGRAAARRARRGPHGQGRVDAAARRADRSHSIRASPSSCATCCATSSSAAPRRACAATCRRASRSRARPARPTTTRTSGSWG